MNQNGSVLLIMIVLIFLAAIGGTGIWFYYQQSKIADESVSTVDTEIEFRQQADSEESSTDYTQVQENYNLNSDQLEILSRVDNSRL